MKKILLISYFFPPDSAVGGLRIARFAKHLPSFGWTPFVLTIKDRYRQRLDQGRMKDVQEVTIFQTSRLLSLRDIYLLVKSTLLGGGKVERGFIKSASSEGSSDTLGNETITQKLKRYFISLFVFLPDEDKNWIFPAALKAISEIKRHKIECILTSGPPHSSHLIGLLVKKATKVKWVVDLRDPWIDFLPFRTPLGRSALSDRIEHWMERVVVRHADRVLTTTPELKNALKRRYQNEPADKFIDILNGIDTEKFASQYPIEKYHKFTITYAGALYEGRTPEPLFAAIKKLIDAKKISASQIAVKLFGDCQSIGAKPTIDVARSYGLEGIVEISKPVPYSEAIEMMRRSHLLLLLVPSVHYLCIPAKVYDYFGAGTKILAVTEQGATSELVKATRSGECFPPQDIAGISNYIYMLMQNENRHLLINDPACYIQFDTKRLTQQFAKELTALADDSQLGLYSYNEKTSV